jgi:hypothetical protein
LISDALGRATALTRQKGGTFLKNPGSPRSQGDRFFGAVNAPAVTILADVIFTLGSASLASRSHCCVVAAFWPNAPQHNRSPAASAANILLIKIASATF